MTITFTIPDSLIEKAAEQSDISPERIKQDIIDWYKSYELNPDLFEDLLAIEILNY